MDYNKFINIYEAENEIREMIKFHNNNSAHFQFYENYSDDKNKLELIRYNNETKQSILLHSITLAVTKLELYNLMYISIKQYFEV
jgi:hypothetical protein